MVLEPQASYSLLPSQQQLLLRIQHLVTLESSLALVAGRTGAGKYTIASSLLEQYSSDFNQAWITCHKKSSTESLRQQVVSQLVPSAQTDSSQTLLQLLNQQEGEPVRWMIVVNQAELLGNPLLVELWSLIEHCKQNPGLGLHISVVLFSEPDWAKKVAREMANLTGRELPVLQVPALSVTERKQLFVHLQSVSGEQNQDVELNERVLSEQEGLPGEIVAMFEPKKGANPQPELEDDASPALSLSKKLFLGLVGAIPAIVILLWAYQSEEAAKQPERRPGPALDLAKPSAEQLSPSEEAANPQESLPPLVKDKTITITVEDDAEKQVVVDEKTIEAIKEKLPETPKKSVVLAAKPRSTEVLLEPEIKSVPVADKSPETKPLAWWQKIPSNHFVLQMVLMSSEEGLDRFAQKHGLTNDPEFRRYPAKRNGKQVYIGVYGDFATKDQARQSAVQFKAKGLAPWPKSAVAVQQEAVLLD